jgi:hypothetical protein
MAVTADKPGAYTSPNAITDFIGRVRERGLPSPINADVLARASVVSGSLIPRTLQSAEVLDLIDADGMPTQNLEGLRLASEPEFKARMGEWLKKAYADVFKYVDPANDDVVAIRDAFRSYKPIGQQERMVTLFIGLCTAAGLMPDKPKAANKPLTPVRERVRPRVVSAVGSTRRKDESVAKLSFAESPPAFSLSKLPPPLAGLLTTLPSPETGWTRAKRDAFVSAFGTVLDFCIPVGSVTVEDAKGENENGGT